MYFNTSIDIIIFPLFFGILALAAYKDVISYRIPNAISLILAILYPAYVLFTASSVDWIGGLVVALVVLAIGVIFFVTNLMGGGDVKLMAVVALWAGPAAISDFVVVMALAGLVLASVLMTPLRKRLALAFEKAGNAFAGEAVRRKTLPYGVAISAGGIAVGLRLINLQNII